MATEIKSKPNNTNKNNNKKRKNYLPHNRPVKKGAYPLRPGVQGFFITCDGGREYQASYEAINVIDSFYEELMEGRGSKVEQPKPSKKPANKIIKFSYSDSSGDEDDNDDAGKTDANKNHPSDGVNIKEKGDEDTAGADGGNTDAGNNHPSNGVDIKEKGDEDKPVSATGNDVSNESGPQGEEDASFEKATQGIEEKVENLANQEVEAVMPPLKKRVATDSAECGNESSNKVEKKFIDELIEAELAELGDRSKRRFSKLDPGCNGVVFIQMSKRDGDPSPKDIIQHMMTSLASSRKHVSRFLLRVLPIEIACYASDEEITRAIKPLIDKYFPEEKPHKFAVIYDSRANTGVDRTKIIGVVAKSVPPPHKVDLGNPDLTIMVQIVKTVCLIGVVENYKELSKYNIRQLTSTEK